MYYLSYLLWGDFATNSILSNDKHMSCRYILCVHVCFGLSSVLIVSPYYATIVSSLACIPGSTWVHIGVAHTVQLTDNLARMCGFIASDLHETRASAQLYVV